MGRNPYPGIGNHEILEYVSDGERLKKPTLCPEKLLVFSNNFKHATKTISPLFVCRGMHEEKLYTQKRE